MPLSLQPEASAAISRLRKPVTTSAVRRCEVDRFIILKPHKNELRLIQDKIGGSAELFQALRENNEISVAFARFQVGHALSKYVKFFGVYYNPVANEAKVTKSTGLRASSFRVLGSPLLTYDAYGVHELNVNSFSHKVLKFAQTDVASKFFF